MTKSSFVAEAMAVVDGGNEPDSPDSFDKRLMSFASSKFSEHPENLATRDEPSPNDKFSVRGDSCSSLNGNKQEIETHQANLNSRVTDLPRDVTVKQKFTLIDYKGTATLRQKVTKKVIEELQLKGKNDSEPVTEVQSTSARYSPQKHRGNDSCGVVFTPNNCSTPYSSKLRKRKRLTSEGKSKPRQTFSKGSSDSESDSESALVKSPSLLSAVEKVDNQIPQLRRSPRKKLMKERTNSSSEQGRESGKQSEVSDNTALEHASPREPAGSSVAQHKARNNGDDCAEDTGGDCEDTALMMATDFKVTMFSFFQEGIKIRSSRNV